jgi:hypothetical protein
MIRQLLKALTIAVCTLAATSLQAAEKMPSAPTPLYAQFYSNETQTVGHHDSSYHSIQFEKAGDHNEGRTVTQQQQSKFRIPTTGAYRISYGAYAQTAPGHRSAAIGLRKNQQTTLGAGAVSVQANLYSSCSVITALREGDIIELANLSSCRPDLTIGVSPTSSKDAVMSAYISFELLK